MARNFLIGQSGGPTAAINASLAGALKQALNSPEICEVYGAHNGIKGVFERDFIDLRKSIKSDEDLQLLKETPAMALGSCRFKLPDFPSPYYETILNIFREYNIGYFLYIGGNDSMDTVKKLSAYFSSINEDIRVAGIPKTIDNDLCCTDHTPGFGSAAKYIAASVAEIACDSSVYDDFSVTIVEIMGRNAGWLTASSALARLTGCGAPHMIYLPETVFDPIKFVEDLKAIKQKVRHIVVAVSEGLKLADGSYAGESKQSGLTDAFGHKYLSGIGKYLEEMVKNELHCKVRSVNLNVLQRAASHITSFTDINEAFAAGESAVRFALSGKTGVVAVIRRVSNSPYTVDYDYCEVNKIANYVKFVPQEWIASNGYDITAEMMEYLKPLILGESKRHFKFGLPEFFSLTEKV